MSAQPQAIVAWRLLPMHKSHLPQMLAIERSAYEFPWNEGIFRDCLRAGYSIWVAQGTEVAINGYAVMSLAVGEAHLLNLCVEPRWQGHGLGRQLTEHLLALARRGGCTRMLLEVRRSNRHAQRLYEGLGFVRVGLRRGYYPARDGREDAWVLVYEIV
ncbi:MAG: ribosomal protein S18-alanine N-acetyltransferase [Gammaproteobacteria bacterium]|nr:ribosomal protein S18-alanine N-acetyltransferase [Gammaproteobacteria bacterium]